MHLAFPASLKECAQNKIPKRTTHAFDAPNSCTLPSIVSMSTHTHNVKTPSDTTLDLSFEQSPPKSREHAPQLQHNTHTRRGKVTRFFLASSQRRCVHLPKEDVCDWNETEIREAPVPAEDRPLFFLFCFLPSHPFFSLVAAQGTSPARAGHSDNTKES